MTQKNSAASRLSFVLSAILAACSSGGAPTSADSGGAPSSATGGAHNLAGGSGSSDAAASAGSAGASISASGGGSGPLGSAGSANGDAGSGGAGSGGVSGGGSSGMASAGSAQGGTAGSAQGGTAGSPNDLAAAAVLDHYQLLDPCQSGYKGGPTPGDVCPQDTAVKNQKIMLQFGGDSSLTYDVTLHVRGIMEGYWYTGGTLDASSKTFYTGGVPTVGGLTSACKNKTSELPFKLPAEITPTDNCWNGFNMFALTVSAPQRHYYLNYTSNKDNDRPPHAVYQSDYTVTIPIQGQAKLEFYIIGSDEHQCYNFNKVVSGVSTTPSPYIGEFVQFDVMKVTRSQSP